MHADAFALRLCLTHTAACKNLPRTAPKQQVAARNTNKIEAQTECHKPRLKKKPSGRKEGGTYENFENTDRSASGVMVRKHSIQASEERSFKIEKSQYLQIENAGARVHSSSSQRECTPGVSSSVAHTIWARSRLRSLQCSRLCNGEGCIRENRGEKESRSRDKVCTWHSYRCKNQSVRYVKMYARKKIRDKKNTKRQAR